MKIIALPFCKDFNRASGREDFNEEFHVCHICCLFDSDCLGFLEGTSVLLGEVIAEGGNDLVERSSKGFNFKSF